MKRHTPGPLLLALLAALVACKGSKKSAEPTAAPAPTPAPTPKRPFEPGVSQLRKVCDGQAVPGLDPLPRDKAGAALFVRKEPGGELEHVKYDDLVANKDGLAYSLELATLVACIDVKKKKKLESCSMTSTDPTKLGGTLNIYSYDYVVSLRETSTGKLLSEEKKTRADKKCPSVWMFTKSEEDFELPFAAIATSAVFKYRGGK